MDLSSDSETDEQQRQQKPQQKQDDEATAPAALSASALTLDKDMEAHLLSVCQAVGGYEIDEDAEGNLKEKYLLGDEALDCLRDLKRFVRFDDRTEGKCILRKLGEWRFFHTDLLPIFTQHADNQRLSEAAVELLVPLTWPIDPKDAAYAEQMQYMLRYKSAICDAKVVQAMFGFLLKYLSKDPRERTDRDLDSIRMLLTLCRNVLAIPDPQLGEDVASELALRATLQERLIRTMHDNNLLELFITFAGSMDEHHNAEWNMTVLEIFYHIFAPYAPSDILEQPEAEENMLLKSLLQQEQRSTQFKSSRHGRFGGSILIKSGPNSQRVLSGTKPLNQQIDHMFDAANKKFIQRDKKSKIKDNTGQTKLIKDDHFRKILRRVAEDFLESCFNILMISVKKDLAAERVKVRDEDYDRYLFMVTFFLKYQHEKAVKTCSVNVMNVELISGALDRMSIVFVLKQIDKHNSEKNHVSLRLSINSLTQILGIIRLMSESENEDIRDVAHNLQSNFFYERAHIDLLRSIVKYPLSFARPYLGDLVAMNHQLMRMMEHYAKSSVIFARTKSHRKKKRQQDSTEGTAADEEEEDEYEREAANEYSEKALEFQHLEMALANESVINTYFALLRDYESLRPETISHVCKMFHRIFVKCEMQALFYRLDMLDLFNDIMINRIHLSRKNAAFKDLVTFVRYLVGKLVKKFAEYPLLFVELLYPKTKRSDIMRIQNGEMEIPSVSFDENDEEQGPTEITVSETIPWSERVGVLVTSLMEQEKAEQLEWICDLMTDVAQMRDDDSSAASMEDHVVDTANAEIRKSLAKDGHFRALLGLLRFEEREVLAAEDDAEQAETDKGAAPPQKHWYLPFSMLAHDLQYNVELIRQYQETPYQSTKPLAKLLKKKKKRVVRERDDDDEPAPRNRADRPEPPGKFLSAQFVDDSGDEDEDERLVMEYRRRMEQMRNADFVEDESEHQAALERIQNELDTEERLAPVRRRTSAGKSGKAAERSDDEEQASEASDEDVASASDSDEVDDDGASAKSTSDDEDEDGSNSDSVNDAAPVDLDGLLSEDSDDDLENELPALASINQNAQSSQVKSPMVAKVPLSETQAASPAFVKRRKLLIADDVGR